jgi:hypothetical protein
MPRRIFSFLNFLILGCAAATANAQASHPCELPPSSDPSYSSHFADIKRAPDGKWGLAYTFDAGQFADESVSVVVRGLLGLTSQKDRGGKLKCAEIENRSTRTVRTVQLRWFVTEMEGSEKVLAQGILPVAEVETTASGKLKAELREAQFADFLQPLVKDGVLTGHYKVSVGVARVWFTDGTTESFDTEH